MTYLLSRLEHAARTFLRGDLPQRRARAAVEREVFDLNAFEEENECLEGDACENCDGRKCMGCVFREYDHDCADDCPECCPTTCAGPSMCSLLSCARFGCADLSIQRTPETPARPPVAQGESPRGGAAGPVPPVSPPSSGCSTSELLIAAANQLCQLQHHIAPGDRYRRKFIAELIPELRSAANDLPAQLGSQCGAEPEEGSADTTQPSETAPSSGQIWCGCASCDCGAFAPAHK